MTLYDTIREDICNVLPDEITDLIPLYLGNMTFDQKFQTMLGVEIMQHPTIGVF